MNRPQEDLNLRIIEILKVDGRISNREVARRLGVSESAVRQRLKKMELAGQVRHGLVVDLSRTGRNVVVWLRLSVALAHMENVLEQLAEMEEAAYVATVSGQYNILAVIAARNLPSLRTLIDDKVETLRGVLDVDVRIIGQSLKHNFHEIAISKDL